MEHALPILAGLLLLALGGELLVRGAARLAQRLGISPLLVGLTVVGFGTSTPELVTSVQASLAGSPGIAVGNVVGSNIGNTLLILGLAALVAPLAVGSRALGRDGAIGAAAALGLLGIGLFGTLDRLAGAVLVLLLAAYLGFAWWQESRAGPGGEHGAAFDRALAFEGAHPDGTVRPPPGQAVALPGSILLLGAGLGGVVWGGGLLVGGAIGLAGDLGVPETVVGLTVVAIGTSLPELVTSLVAAARRQAEVALGNVLGSNIYNILGIAGATGLLAPTAIPAEIARFDAPVMVGAAFLLLLFARTRWRIGRREGAMLLAAYALYLWALWPG